MIPLYSKNSIQLNQHLMSHYYAKVLRKYQNDRKHFDKAKTATSNDHEFMDYESWKGP